MIASRRNALEKVERSDLLSALLAQGDDLLDDELMGAPICILPAEAGSDVGVCYNLQATFSCSLSVSVTVCVFV